jgi:hypothetical protein
MSQKKKSLHHEVTEDVIEALDVIKAPDAVVDVDAKKFDLLATVSLARTVLNVKNVARVKNVHHVKHELSVLLESQRGPNVLLVALLHGIAAKALRVQANVVTHEHLEWLRSSQTFQPGKKQSVPFR